MPLPTSVALPSTSAGGFSAIGTAGPRHMPVIPGYEIEELLGRGGMGVVYRARHLTLKRDVAVKMILAGDLATPEQCDRFRSEAEAVARLQHPNIVQIYEVGTVHGVPFAALELVTGGTLAERLSAAPPPRATAAALIRTLAETIHYAHQRGVVHRDLKPANILLATGEARRDHDDPADFGVPATRYASLSTFTPKITDFGLARQLDVDSDQTRSGALLGTPSYMAPEQAAGHGRTAGPAADIYTLGVLLYECLTGRPPFKAANLLDTLEMVRTQEPVPPTRLQPKTPRNLEIICLKCLQKAPARRYPDAAALADDLGRFLNGQAILARPVPTWERAWKAARRRPAVAGLALALAGALVVALTVILVSNFRLRHERDQSRAARLEADGQRLKSQEHLEKAVEAVEKMMTRVAGERWARRPELQDERRQVLEDAAAFYRLLLERDGDSPLVRREAARVHTRAALFYLTLADYARAEQAATAARTLLDGLHSETPDDAEVTNDLANAALAQARVHALTGRYTESAADYRACLRLADEAVATAPNREEFCLTLVHGLILAGQFWTASDPGRASEYQNRAMTLSASWATRPGQLCRSRALFRRLAVRWSGGRQPEPAGGRRPARCLRAGAGGAGRRRSAAGQVSRNVRRHTRKPTCGGASYWRGRRAAKKASPASASAFRRSTSCWPSTRGPCPTASRNFKS